MEKEILIPVILLTSFLALAGVQWWEPKVAASATMEHTQEAPKIDPTLIRFLSDYEAYLNQAMEESGVPGLAVAVVKDSNVIFKKGFGVKEANTRDSVDEHTVFRLASLSKGFAPVLTGILAEERCLQWEDKVVSYVPDFRLSSRRNTKELNLQHVLSHTTGLPRHAYSNLIDRGGDYATARRKLRKVKIAHPVGAYYNYQNVAFSLIADVIEKACGRNYVDLMQEKVYTPLGMTNASTTYEAIMENENVALPHRHYGHGFKKVDISPNYYVIPPAAGVNASINDMAQWLQLLMGNRPDVISQETLDQIFTPYVDLFKTDRTLRRWRPVDHAYYAMGWRVLEKAGRRIIYHGGYVNNYRAEIAFDPDEKIGVVVLCNAPVGFMSEVLPTFFEMYNREVS